MSETEYPLCLHKTILLLQLFQLKGADYFETIRNWDREKNKLLALYGYTLDDYIEDKFEFIYHDGKPFLKVLDEKVLKLNANTSITTIKRPNSNDWDLEEEETISVKPEVKERFGIVMQHQPTAYPYIIFNVIKGEVNEEGTSFIGKVEKVDLAKLVVPALIKKRIKF